MAQQQPDQNFYHYLNAQPHRHSHSQWPPQFRNPFDMLFDDRVGAINYYIRPYLQNEDDPRRPRRTRTTFTTTQIAKLEQQFSQGRYLTAPRLAELSEELGLGSTQVKIWFKNRRRRRKVNLGYFRDQSYDGRSMNLDLPSLQTLSLSCNWNADDVPSPTAKKNLSEQNDGSFDSYYHNGHKNRNRQANGQSSHQSVNARTTRNAATTSQFCRDDAIQSQSLQLQQQNQVHSNLWQNGAHQQATKQQQQRRHLQRQNPQFHQVDQQKKKSGSSGVGCRLLILKNDLDSDYNLKKNTNYAATKDSPRVPDSKTDDNLNLSNGKACSAKVDMIEQDDKKNKKRRSSPQSLELARNDRGFIISFMLRGHCSMAPWSPAINARWIR